MDPNRQLPIFIVSTGRCGSTFLSAMLNQHPDIISISELFEPILPVPYVDNTSILSGTRFLEMLAAKTMQERIDIWRYKRTKECRFLSNNNDENSLLLGYTLSQLSNEPLALFEEVKSAVKGFPDATPADHLLALFHWLCQRFNKKVWVERTGGSIAHMEQMAALWPHAKFIHSFRDGRDCALSMHRHPIFSLFVARREGEPWHLDYQCSLEATGLLWNEWTVNGVEVLDQLPANQVLNLSYESFFEQTDAMLDALIRFILGEDHVMGEEDKIWMNLFKQQRQYPYEYWSYLSLKQQLLLQDACAEGLEKLGYQLELIGVEEP